MSYGGWDGCGPNCPVCSGEPEQEGPFPCDCPLDRIECSSEVCQSYDDPEIEALFEKFNERFGNGKKEEAKETPTTLREEDALPEAEVD